MNKSITFSKLFIVALAALATSCSNKHKDVSQTTGWKINTSKNGGFEAELNYEQDLPVGMVFVEGGSFIMGQTEEDVLMDNNATPRQVSVASFYMDETEVTNTAYREYLFWLNRVFGESYPEVYWNALPDTNAWRSELGYNDPLVNNYLRHAGFSHYPVVGVSWDQTQDYCAWRTDRVNELALIDEGALKHNTEQFDDDNFNTETYRAGQYTGSQKKGYKDLANPKSKTGRRGRLEDGVLTAGYRLPTEAEWEKACCWNEERQEKTIFPWGDEEPKETQANLLESHFWAQAEIGSYPAGKSPAGCQQMIGDIWEWTSSEFTGYPGFRTGFDEYNDKWFTNQKVLRGGSFGTPKMSIRGSYRNFFRLDERWLFSGFRCVEDI